MSYAANMLTTGFSRNSGAGIEYPTGTAQINGVTTGDFVPGRRCPDLRLISVGTGKSLRVYSLLRYGKFVILQFSEEIHLPEHLEAYYEVWDLRSGNHEVEANGVGDGRRYQIEGDVAVDQKVVIIRPDAYVGYCGADVKGYLKNALG